ncbi:unnamed protein product, partial [Rotaria sp. Silwood1]
IGSQQSSLTAAATRLTPIPDRLRSFVAKKRGRISENEENDENNNDTSVLHYADASRNGKSMKTVS